MERVTLNELNFKNRDEALAFLKNDCDWQCKTCNKTYKTIHLLDEINEQM